jgi:prepilin-type N-terminal cleavage/methylation domain-containing protein/prepilin-type processing-associated H-X9-DG protein
MAKDQSAALRPGAAEAFTLIEVLVVVAIIALLVAMLLPSLARARAQASALKCQANVREIGLGMVMYTQSNRDFAVPSYNLPWLPGATTNFSGGANQPLDGWACILDRDRLVRSNQRDKNTTFYCPNTVDVEAIREGGTGADPDKPRGWTDWPMVLLSGTDNGPKLPVTIPERGFKKIIRVTYWLNAYNPIGASAPGDIEANDLYYTGSPLLGPDSKGRYMQLHKMRVSRASPARFIMASDGVYMGRQSRTHPGDIESRIGYRHPSPNRMDGAANVILADGHVETLWGDRFPRALSAGDSPEVVAQKRRENLSGPTVYFNPRQVFP